MNRPFRSARVAFRPNRSALRHVLVVAVLGSLVLGGCDALSTKSDPTRQRPRPRRQTTSTGADVAAVPPDVTTVDAMIGQINGRPLYASTIFDEIGVEQLKRLGVSKPRPEFREEVTRLLYAHLNQMITDELVLAEAESSLTEQQRSGLSQFVKAEREKILARFGGVLTGARKGVLREYNMTLEDYLKSKRQEVLIQKYLADRIWPKVHVNRREIERFYLDNRDLFNPDPSVVLRIILTGDPDTADRIDDALKKGQPFEAVARQYSAFRRDQGGLMPAYKARLKTFDKLKGATAPLNEQVRKLSEGQHSRRTPITIGQARGYAWVCLVSVKGMKSQSLREVYLQIENTLRKRKFDEQSRLYMVELLNKGNYTAPEEMLPPLVEVAMNRYAQSQ